MRDDLISRRAAIDAICEHGTDLERRGITILAVANYKQASVDLLENLPSAEPERKTGHWVIDEEGMIHCSECTKIPTNRIRDCFKVLYDIHPLKMNYCPNCGVEMRGGEDG
jgi:hypothetical protein